MEPVAGFVDLAVRAGFAENRAPVGTWLQVTFGVNTVADMDREVLAEVVASFAGPQGASKFAEDVAAAVALTDAGLLAGPSA